MAAEPRRARCNGGPPWRPQTLLTRHDTVYYHQHDRDAQHSRRINGGKQGVSRNRRSLSGAPSNKNSSSISLIMSSTPSKSLYENLALETVQVGGTKVSLPALPPTGASDTELALYLNSLISQLESVESRTTASDRLLALGNRTALSIYPQSTITSVRDKIDAELFNPANFTFSPSIPSTVPP